MACVFWQDECKNTIEVFMKKSNHEDVMKMILKECEDKNECKGGGSSREISSPMKKVCHGKFQGQHIFKRRDGNAYRA
jgi:hypothetical protein